MIKDELNNYLKTLPDEDRNINKIIMYLAKRSKTYEESKESYGCEDMQFEPKLPTSEVLQRYNITVDEYNTICTELENKLYVGKCGWCI